MEKLELSLPAKTSCLPILKSSILSFNHLLQTILQDEEILKCIEDSYKLISSTLLSGSKLILAGNGGSAAEASHIAAEYVVRFKK